MKKWMSKPRRKRLNISDHVFLLSSFLQGITSSSQSELQWLSYGYRKVYDAFQSLQTDPSVKVLPCFCHYMLIPKVLRLCFFFLTFGLFFFLQCCLKNRTLSVEDGGFPVV